MKPVVFFDRDDTLLRANMDCLYYITRPHEINPVQGILAPLRSLCEVGARLFVVSNQNCISDGIMSSMQVANLNDLMVADFAKEAVLIRSVAFSHGNKSPYDKANAKAGLIAGLRRIHCPDLPLENTWMVGDSWDDMKAGEIAHCRTIHLWYPDSYIVDYLEDSEILEATKVMRGPKPDIESELVDFQASDMEEVVRIILSLGI